MPLIYPTLYVALQRVTVQSIHDTHVNMLTDQYGINTMETGSEMTQSDSFAVMHVTCTSLCI